MPVSQSVIDLMNLSLAALKQLASGKDVPIPAGATKPDIVRALQHLTQDEIDFAAADLMYAGNTSITWIRVGDGTGFGVGRLRQEINALEGADPFAEALRPEQITMVPRLVNAREWNGKVVLTFVYRKRVQTVIRNFELVSVYGDDFFQVIVRHQAGDFEVRASHDKARLLERTWLTPLAERMDAAITLRLISIEQFDELRDRLGGKLDIYRGKDEDGSIYDTREWSRASTCDDLAGEAEFIRDTEGMHPVSEDILFEVDDGSSVRLRISSNGSVWFRTVVSEEVIDTVYEELQRVGAL